MKVICKHEKKTIEQECEACVFIYTKNGKANAIVEGLDAEEVMGLLMETNAAIYRSVLNARS